MDTGERAAFREFVDGRSPGLLRTAYLLTGDWHLAEDLLQTALSRAYLAWSRVSVADSPDAYVRRILVNSWAKWWRRRWRGETPTAAMPETAGPDPYAAVDDRSSLAAALATLPKRQRAVVVLRYYDDLSEAEIAAVLGCSPGTVKSQASKALAKLRVDPSLAPEKEVGRC